MTSLFQLTFWTHIITLIDVYTVGASYYPFRIVLCGSGEGFTAFGISVRNVAGGLSKFSAHEDYHTLYDWFTS